MKIENIKLEHFRNYSDSSYLFDAPLIVLEGKNGAGKTNILEALSVLSFTKSPRASRDDQMVQQDFDVARVSSDFTSAGVKKNILMVIDKSSGRSKKLWRLQKVPKRPADIIGQLQVVLFRPDDLNLLITTPHERRNYLDLIIARQDKNYLSELNRLSRILSQRKAALEIIREGGNAALGVLNVQLIKQGSLVSLSRQRLLSKLLPLYQAALIEMAPRNVGLLKLINQSFYNDEPKTLNQFQEIYKRAIKQNEGREIGAARNLVGPQRSDLQILLNGKLLRDFGSRGEWRTGILALKKSESVIIEQTTGQRPVLLLDDVTSELDKSRQATLVSWIRQQQTFLATTRSRDLPHELQKDSKLIKVGSLRAEPAVRDYALT